MIVVRLFVEFYLIKKIKENRMHLLNAEAGAIPFLKKKPAGLDLGLTDLGHNFRVPSAWWE
jgi:hypothetical protein